MNLNVHEAAMGEWQLRLEGAGLNTSKTLSFVPLWMGQADWQSGSNERQLVYCHAMQSEDVADSDWGTGENSVLNPLQFYSVERVQARIEGWLLSSLCSIYPMAVSPLPATLITRLVEAFPNTFAPGNSGALALKAIPLCEKNTLHRWMSNAKFSEQNKSVAENALNVAMLMSACKACGEIVDVRAIDADSHGYRASCQCGYGWRWRFHSAQKKRTARYAYGSEQRSFEADGSDAMAFEIDVLGGQS